MATHAKPISEYMAHYLQERNHQGLEGKLIRPVAFGQSGELQRSERLGGLLNYYWRQAA